MSGLIISGVGKGAGDSSSLLGVSLPSPTGALCLCNIYGCLDNVSAGGYASWLCFVLNKFCWPLRGLFRQRGKRRESSCGGFPLFY